MVDIQTIPLDELVEDYYESKKDAAICKRAIALQIDYPNLQYRAETNVKIMGVVEAELKRRGKLNLIGKGGDDGGSKDRPVEVGPGPAELGEEEAGT